MTGFVATAGRCASKVEQDLLLGLRRLETALLVIIEDGIDDALRLIYELNEVHVFWRDHAFRDECRAEPVDHAAPERLVHQNDRHLARLSGLHERQRFHDFIERAEAARQYDVSRSELNEHYFAREEVVEVLADVLIEV